MTVIDASGKFITPGLIDTNVHLSLYGGVGERYETLAKYHPRQREIVLEAAQLQLKHGVTTVRDSYGLIDAPHGGPQCDREGGRHWPPRFSRPATSSAGAARIQ